MLKCILPTKAIPVNVCIEHHTDAGINDDDKELQPYPEHDGGQGLGVVDHGVPCAFAVVDDGVGADDSCDFEDAKALPGVVCVCVCVCVCVSMR